MTNQRSMFPIILSIIYKKMYVKHCEFLCMRVYFLFGIRKHLNDKVHDEKFQITPGYLMHLE